MAAMVVCPVCEHPQAVGEDCQVCGRRLSGPGVVPLPFDRVPGLEPTRLDPGGEAPPQLVADLEPTQHPAAALAAAPAVELESGRAAPVAVEAVAVPGLERTPAEPSGDSPTGPPLTLVCRYCRTESPPGEVICGRCGMRLPTWDLGAAGLLLEPVELRCFACGTRNVGDICSGCGALIRRG